MIVDRMKIKLLFSLFFCFRVFLFSQNSSIREKILIDDDWKFAFGHQYDTTKDFNHGIAYFNYLTKAGNGDGPADPKFDDRAWRKLNVPHDWAVEAPFSEKGSFSHGFKAASKGFPERNIGWYRKSILIPEEDLGKIITLQFDGVFRHSKVWINGHYLGLQDSGYNGFEYNLTPYLHYGKENIISVRVDTSLEEGWYYEGAGIYRHVYLNKKSPLHIKTNGTFVKTPLISKNEAEIEMLVTVSNFSKSEGEFEIQHIIKDPFGKVVSNKILSSIKPQFYESKDFITSVKLENPNLWSIETPNLYTLTTEIKDKGKVIDHYETKFGIRNFKFDPENGFFLNGKQVKLKGTNNHQDHAGVGVALPDELIYWRIKKLKEMGSNAYRTSHHPPTPELLKACDELGMVVINEARLMGVNDFHLDNLKYLIERDRNHPSVIVWSVGNEEWKIEGNDTGKRIANVLQEYAHRLDPTRPVTIGLSSGFQSGISDMVEIIGYNYLGNGDIDKHRNQFKHQSGMGTEEGSTHSTRGIYFSDDGKQYKAAYDNKPRSTFYSIQEGWRFYAERPYLAGVFFWTGFDYRGEPTPYGWPSVHSYFGLHDTAGFPKDNVFYLKSWWGTEPVLHILPHWNWEGKEGEIIDVWVYSNVEEVELFLNKKSLGRKIMEHNGHLEWKVAYQKGEILAVGYKDGKKVMQNSRKTTSTASSIKMNAHKTVLNDTKDLAIITVEMLDKNGLSIPTANQEITFNIKGGGKIIGVGNGDPTSLEKDRFIDKHDLYVITDLKEQKIGGSTLPQILPSLDEKLWTDFFLVKDKKENYAYKGKFQINDLEPNDKVTYFFEKIGNQVEVFVNGVRVESTMISPSNFEIPTSILKNGDNEIILLASPQQKENPWDEPHIQPGVIQVFRDSEPWKRKLFNGLAQIIVQNDGSKDDIILTATSPFVKSNTIVIKKKK